MMYTENMRSDHCPRWVFFVVAFSQFVYQTMDAIDGKQARRTETSSPLGELCDHGCDALSISLITVQLIAAVNLGAGWLCYFGFWTGLVLFYACQWEEYYTGRLDLGYVNVTEAETLVIIFNIISGIYGPSWWEQSFSVFGIQISYNVCIIMLTCISIICTLPANIFHVATLVHKGVAGLIDAVSTLFAFYLLVILFYIWGYISPLNPAYNYPVYFCVTLGLAFANLIGRMVLSRVCGQKFNPFQPLFIPIILGILTSFLGQQIQAYYLIGNCFFFLLLYIVFAHGVIRDITDELGIQFISISEEHLAMVIKKREEERLKKN